MRNKIVILEWRPTEETNLSGSGIDMGDYKRLYGREVWIEVFTQTVDNLDLQAVIAVVNGLEKPYVMVRDSLAERLLKICNCGHTRMYHVLAGGEKCERCDCQGFNESSSQPDPNPLDRVNYKDGA